MNSSNKRRKDDRRTSEYGPPKGWRERRNTVERRRPEVHEISFSEWISIMRSFNVRSQETA